MRTLLLMLAGAGLAFAADKKMDTFDAYADTDLCAHLMLGPISPERIECSRSTLKDGSEAALVRLSDNLVFAVNKPKMLKEVVGELVSATGETKEKDSKIKLESVKSIPMDSIKAGAPGAALLDARNFKLTGEGAKTHEKIRHELAMMPYWTTFDFISFALVGDQVILTGWTVRQTNRSTAYNIVKQIEGVRSVTNNIEVLPLGSFDMQIRAGVRAALQRHLGRYFWGSGSDIKIIVKNGNVILLGTVASKADSDIAFMQANSVSGAFKIFNMLKVKKG